MVKLVIIESPFAAPTVDSHLENIEYAWACMRDSLERGEAPFASHLIYPKVLEDRIPAQRHLGMRLGWAWMRVADLVAVYTDRGISLGMQEGISHARGYNIPVEYRTLDPSVQKESPK